jgi:indole-3-glycerol phosphate synthase
VNNRNLKTLEVNLETSFQLRAKMPCGCLAVSESGIKTAADLRRISEAGFDAALIGERFMTQPDPGKALLELLAEFAGQPAPVEIRNSKVEAR